MVAVDTMEFPPSKSQHRYLLGFPGSLHAVDRGKTSPQGRWEVGGKSDYLLNNNGKEFDNKLVMGTLEEYEVRHMTTPPYHPQANPL